MLADSRSTTGLGVALPLRWLVVQFISVLSCSGRISEAVGEGQVPQPHLRAERNTPRLRAKVQGGIGITEECSPD